MNSNQYKCPCCFNNSANLLYRKTDNPLILQGLSDNSIITKCEKCESAFVSPMPTDKDLKFIYQDVFDYQEKLARYEQKGLEKFFYRIEKEHGKKGRFLDIGCASGFLLEIAENNGWEPFGIDLSPKLLKEAKDRVKTSNIILGKIEDSNYNEEYFDVITAIAILEYLTDPLSFIKEVNKILKPGGLFIFKTVCIDSYPAKKYGINWDHLKWPGHLIFFSTQSLKNMLAVNNLTIINWKITGLPFFPFKKNIKSNNYKNSKNDKLKNYTVHTSIVKKIAKVILNNLIIKSFFSFIIHVFGLGDTVTVIVKK